MKLDNITLSQSDDSYINQNGVPFEIKRESNILGIQPCIVVNDDSLFIFPSTASVRVGDVVTDTETGTIYSIVRVSAQKDTHNINTLHYEAYWELWQPTEKASQDPVIDLRGANVGQLSLGDNNELKQNNTIENNNIEEITKLIQQANMADQAVLNELLSILNDLHSGKPKPKVGWQAKVYEIFQALASNPGLFPAIVAFLSGGHVST